MGLFNRKSESVSLSDLEGMSDAEIKGLIKSGQVPNLSAKDLRKQATELRRKVHGETGLGAIRDALKGGGTGNRNYQNIPLKDRVHPAEYRRLMEKEAKRQGLL